jgi:hypothetical protein
MGTLVAAARSKQIAKRCVVLGALVLTPCGAFATDVLDGLKKLRRDLPPPSSRNLVMKVDRGAVDAGLVRYVASVGEEKTISVEKGQVLGDVARAYCGIVYPEYLKLLVETNVDFLAPSLSAESPIPKAGVLRMPGCVRFMQIGPIGFGGSRSWSEITLRNNKQRESAKDEIRRRLGTVTFESASEISLYSDMSQKLLAEIGACQRPSTKPAFDAIEILQVVAANNRHMPSFSRGAPVLVVVPDTGLYTDGKMPFPEHRVDRIGWSRRVTDPDEGIAPTDTTSRGQHGTHVASLALGGPELLGLLDSLDVKLRLAPINILNADGGVALNSLSNAIGLADSTNAVVNLSVGRQTPFIEVSSALESRSDVLFIVAAGNDKASLQERRVYPASYGGENEGRYNLITVAATDTDGTLAAFSNYHAKYVDIAAPGCRQRAYERDAAGGYRVVEVSGTSFAAPQVSFTAALLRAMWPNKVPSRIKGRILAGSDISPLLDPMHVAHSRKLNVAKALAVYQDVVDAKLGGEIHRIRGRITSPDKFALCGGTLDLHREFAPGRNTVRKVARVSRPSAAVLVDWENYNGVFSTQLCTDIESAVQILEEDTGRLHEIAAADLIDIVFAETR